MRLMGKLITFMSILFLATASFAAEISESDVKIFLNDWLTAQNKGSYSNYAAMYSKRFVGIRRSGTSTRKLDYDAWLKDRKNMFKKKMLVAANAPKVKLSGKTASVKFEQTWESGTYKDKGNKVLDLALEDGKLRIIREEMLFSKVISKNDVDEIITAPSGSAQDGSARYTSVKYKNCWEPKGYFAKHFGFPEHTKECPGQKEWRLFRVADSERSWLEIAKGKTLWSTHDEVTGSGEENTFGQVQDLGDLSRVEWRWKSDATSLALIFQVQATDSDSTLNKVVILYRYYVIGLSSGVPQFCGAYKTEEEARGIAENQTNCKTLEERKPAR